MPSQTVEGQQNNVWPWLTMQQQAPKQGINLNIAPPILEQDLHDLLIEEDVHEVPIPPVIQENLQTINIEVETQNILPILQHLEEQEHDGVQEEVEENKLQEPLVPIPQGQQ